MNITISPIIKTICPKLKIGLLTCDVFNNPGCDALQVEMETEIADVKSRYRIDEINKRTNIAATRQVYKALGKDPNRYRPSAEALCRRILRDLPIYRVSSLVDIINIVSIRSGFSIGGFDSDKIIGDIALGIGQKDEPFEAIGRGTLNIENLPVYRDEQGGIGTPTSDNERTKLSEHTRKLVVVINAYDGDNGLEDAVIHLKQLLTRYAEMTRVDYTIL